MKQQARLLLFVLILALCVALATPILARQRAKVCSLYPETPYCQNWK